jgi:hypothetical protein
MADTTFVDKQTVVSTAWLNDVNGIAYKETGVYTPAGTGVVPTTVRDKLRQEISVFDFMTAAQIADVQAGTYAIDMTSALQAAVTAATGKSLHVPAGGYLMSGRVLVNSNTEIFGEGRGTTFKASAATHTNNLFIGFDHKSNCLVRNITFNGNKGNVGTNRIPANIVYYSTKITFEDCLFTNCEGISILVSSSCDDFSALNNIFDHCGGNPNNSDGYRKQGIAFSADVGTRHARAKIIGNRFISQGLDCISLESNDSAIVSNNISDSSYTLLYNSTAPYYSTTLVVSGNTISNCTNGGYVDAVPPNAIDLPSVIGGIVTGNTVTNSSNAGIGIFGGCKDIVVSGNTLINANTNSLTQDLPDQGAICVGYSGTTNIVVSNNIIVDNQGTPTLCYGIILRTDVTNLMVRGNLIVGATKGRLGYFVSPSTGTNANSFPLVSSAPLIASVSIQDDDPAGGTLSNWRKTDTLSAYSVGGVQVVSAPVTGYTAMTGTVDKASARDTATITLVQLAQRVNALQTSLTAHGLISA